MSSIVAIVGRPNVGKSTLFNRLVQRRDAIVDAVSGVTRDRHYGKSDWNGKEFSVIDTGGYVIGSDDIFEGEIRKQVQLAIEESDIIIFVVDVEQGITPMDAEVAKLAFTLSKSNPEAMEGLKKVMWQGSEHWDELLMERAVSSGTLVLSDFTKNAIEKFKTK